MGTPIQATGANMAGFAQHYRVITHNLANSNTAGFKRQIASVAQAEGSTSGATKNSLSIDFDQGRLIHTGRPLDFALEGKGCFFTVETPDNQLYTRNGVFRVNTKGQIVDGAGRMVSGQNGPLVVPPSVGQSDINVSKEGHISAGGISIGQFKIVEFEDPKKLRPAGGVAYTAPEDMEPEKAKDTAVYQGFQEGSNVVAVEELVDLISLSRLYEGNFKSIGAQDDRMKSIIQVAMG